MRSADSLKRLSRRTLLIGLLLLAGVAAAAFAWPQPLLQGWLVASLFWLSLPLGALGLLLMHHLTGGRWGWYSRPLLGAAGATLPLVLLAFVPLALGADALFPWSLPPEQLHEVVRKKLQYLNLPFLYLRLGIYAGIWLLLAALMRVWRGLDEARRQGPAAVGMILYSLTIFFFAYDWILSLEPRFYASTIGFYVAASQFVASVALAIVAAGWLRLPPRSGSAPLLDLGNLLLGAVVFWLYIAFSMYLIIWEGDLPHEIHWYLQRQGIWLPVTLLLILAHFIVPFAVLLMRRAKRHRIPLMTLGAVLLIAHFLDTYWLVVPSFEHRSPWAGLADLAAVLALGALWLALFLALLGRRLPVLSRPEEAG